MQKKRLSKTFYACNYLLLSIHRARTFLSLITSHVFSIIHHSSTSTASKNIHIHSKQNSTCLSIKVPYSSTKRLLGSYISLAFLLVAVWLFLQLSAWQVAYAETMELQADQQISQQASPQDEQSQAGSIPLEKPITADDSENVPGEIVVVFYDDVKRSAPIEATDIVENISISVIENLDLSGLDRFLAAENDDAENISEENGGLSAFQSGQIIHVPVGSESDAIAQLLESPDVAYAMPNRIVRAAGVSVDVPQDFALFPQSGWRSQNSSAHSPVMTEDYVVNDPYYPNQWYMQRIQMIEAWALTLQEDGSSNQLHPVKVAVIDSGIDHLHPEFSGRLITGENYFAPGTMPIDDYGHGTHVAGLIGASVNNGIGITGVAPGVQIISYKTLDEYGNGTLSNVTKAIRDAANAGADVINLSLETGTPDLLLKAAIDYAISEDVIVIASVGNLAPSPVRWPAAYPEVIGVAATDELDQHAPYSCTGIEVEIAAPGGTDSSPIQSTWSSFAECPGSGEVDPAVGAYCYARGTSMSTALVSGAAAMIRGINPDLSADEVRSHLIESVIPLLSEEVTQIGNGLLNTHHAVRLSIASELQVSTSSMNQTIAEGTAPYSATVTLSNPSFDPIEWEMRWQEKNWITNADANSGTIKYGETDTLQFLITPATLSPGSYSSTITVAGTRSNGTKITQRVKVNIVIEETSTNQPESTPTQTPTPSPTSTPPAPEPTVAPSLTPQPPAVRASYNGTNVTLKRTDEPYELEIIISNDEPDPVIWRVELKAANPNEQAWLVTPETLTGTLDPSKVSRIIMTIDPQTMAVGDYASNLTITAENEVTSNAKEFSAQVLVKVEEGNSQVLLPFVYR